MAASADEALARASNLRTSKTCAYCWPLALWASNQLVSGTLSSQSLDSWEAPYPGLTRLPRRNALHRRTDDRHEPQPLSVIRHRDQFLRMSTPVHEASHAEERPADLAECLPP